MSSPARSCSALALTLALAGCGADAPLAPADPPGALARSSLSRATPVVSPDEAAALRAGAADFALDLHRRVAGPGNSVLSPHSIQVAFGMLRPGALAETAAEIDAVMGWAHPGEPTYRAMNALDLELSSRPRDGVRLAIANQSFAQEGFPFESAYLDALATHFGAGVALLDFQRDAEGSRAEINGWVGERTAGNIPELIPEGVVGTDTRLVLVNAVHFDAAWDVAFDPADTRDGVFHRETGGDVTVPLMHVALEAAQAAAGDGWQAVELAYAGEELAMLVVVPTRGTLDALEASLDATGLEAIVAALQPSELEVTMPRFAFGSDVDLVGPLREAGMPRVFDDRLAQLEGIAPAQLYVSAALHSATIRVSEAGTEASAATAVVVGERSGPPQVVLDRPFLFVVRDRATGALLFLGRVADPSA